MPREYRFCVHILQSASRRALYIGMTNNLHKRVWQHKNHRFEGFTDDYNATRLVYWESFDDVRNAIDREKQLKGWPREKKLWLIGRFNPEWRDLAADWYEAQGPSTAGDRSLRERSSSLGMTQLGGVPPPLSINRTWAAPHTVTTCGKTSASHQGYASLEG